MREREEISVIPEGYSDIDIPPELKESVTRHHQHLAALVVSLRSAGLDEALIEASVHQLIASYETELMTAIKALMKAPHHV